MTRAVAVGVFAAACAVTAQVPAGFEPYQGARLLCSGHVSGSGLHVTWQSYATRDRVEAVIGHYEKTTGRKATTLPGGERQIEWNDDHKLAVYPAAEHDRLPYCASAPAPEEHTVILISTAARPPPEIPAPRERDSESDSFVDPSSGLVASSGPSQRSHRRRHAASHRSSATSACRSQAVGTPDRVDGVPPLR